jgi:hypothetical protein
MNRLAQKLGRMAKGHKKTLSPERLEQLKAQAAQMAKIRWRDHVKSAAPKNTLRSAANRGKMSL